MPTITGNNNHSPSYLIEDILPSTEIHLLGGPTGSGKTRWLFDTLSDWEQGLPVLGKQSHPVPWVYVAADRTIDGVNRTLDTMEIPRDAFSVIPAWDDHMTFPNIIDEIEKKHAKLAIIEGFGQFVEPPGHSHQVRTFLCAATTLCKCSDITIIGVVEAPKMKPKDTYANPRQRISGVATWGHHVETIFLMEPANAGSPTDPSRVLTVCPRNNAAIVRKFVFSTEGHLKMLNPGTHRGNGNSRYASLIPEDFGSVQ